MKRGVLKFDDFNPEMNMNISLDNIQNNKDRRSGSQKKKGSEGGCCK